MIEVNYWFQLGGLKRTLVNRLADGWLHLCVLNMNRSVPTYKAFNNSVSCSSVNIMHRPPALSFNLYFTLCKHRLWDESYTVYLKS